MRPQLLVAGISVCAMGVLFLGLGVFLTLSPALTLHPGGGPIGTSVNAVGSGLPTSSRVYVYWYQKSEGDATFFYVATGTVGSDGKFDSPVTFQAPASFQGLHNVTASSASFGPTTPSIPPLDMVGFAQFNLTAASGSGGGISQGPSEPSPLTAWGVISIAVGLLMVGVSFFVKERQGPIEPPEGYRFCVYCSTPVLLDAERCQRCNGLQPKT